MKEHLINFDVMRVVTLYAFAKGALAIRTSQPRRHL